MNRIQRRIDDLLLARATEGLARAEADELEGLLAAHPEVDPSRYERAAAAVTLAALGRSAKLPAALRAKLEGRAAEVVPGSRS